MNNLVTGAMAITAVLGVLSLLFTIGLFGYLGIRDWKSMKNIPDKFLAQWAIGFVYGILWLGGILSLAYFLGYLINSLHLLG